jgi:hypothetical protein
MIAQGFKPVGWVAGVAAAALTCYMLSLNVAAERAELKKLEWRIIMAKKEIRTLQTELGTRGRLTQLENWNANVLALSAPTADQFVDSEVTLARFDRTEDTLGEQAPVRMASADAEKPVATPGPKIGAQLHLAAASAPARPSLVHRASVELPQRHPMAATIKAEPKIKAKEAPKVAVAAEPKKEFAEAKRVPAPAKKNAARIDDSLVKEIRAAAQAEESGDSVGQ